MPAEFGSQLSSQQPTASLVYLPNGQCATAIPCVSVTGTGQQQHPLHHQLLMNGSLLPGNNIGNMPGGNSIISQFNSFNPTMQQQPNEIPSSLSVASTSTLSSSSSTLSISTASMATPQTQLQQTQQQHPLVAMGIASVNAGQSSNSVANHQQTMLTPTAAPLMKQSQSAAAALFHQQQQQENVCFLYSLILP